MKIISSLVFLLFLTSCTNEMFDHIGCGMPPEEDRKEAKALFNDIMTVKANLSEEQAKKIFGCYYYQGDEVYSYSRIIGKGYVLVRYGRPVTSVKTSTF